MPDFTMAMMPSQACYINLHQSPNANNNDSNQDLGYYSLISNQRFALEKTPHTFTTARMLTEPNTLSSTPDTTTTKTNTITLAEIEDAQCTLFRLLCTDSLDKIAAQGYVVSGLLMSHKIDGFNKKFDDLPPSHDPKNSVTPDSVWSGLWRMYDFDMFEDYEDNHINGKRNECYKIMVRGLRATYHYSDRLKTEYTPGEFRQKTLKRVGHRWESQWDEVWPKNDAEQHTEAWSGTSSYAVQAAALYKAAELFRMQE
jgi:hypothetical protein